MKNSQIATIINEQLVPNLAGATPVTEDLKNLVDLGTLVRGLSQTDLLDYQNKFVAGVTKTVFEMRALNSRTLGLRRTTAEFVGIVQRVKMEMFNAEDTDIYNLKAKKKYDRGLTWDGYSMDNLIYTDDTSYRVVHQISLKDFLSAVNSVTSMQSFVAMIEATVQKSLDNQEYALELAMFTTMIAKAKDNEVKLITLYNELTGGSLTAANCLNDYEFLQWAAMTIAELQGYTLDPNKKYNDGTVTTFIPKNDIRTTMLNKFAKAIKFHMYSATFNRDDVTIKVDNEVSAWCSTGEKLLPTISEVGKVDVVIDNGTMDGQAVTIENVVAVIYDYDALGYMMNDRTNTTDWNGDGAFTTFYDNYNGKRIVDPRNTAIVLTLN